MSNASMILVVVVGALLGSMLFFAITVAPTVFRALPAEQAGRFLRAFFPRYYSWGFVLALIAAGLGALSNPVVALACLLVAGLFIVVRQALMPRINNARDDEIRGVPGASKRFKALHLWSVVINGFQMVVLFVAVGVLFWGG